MPAPNTLGIDFGTSNSAAGIAVAGRPWLVELEPGQTTLPTAVFFEEQPRRMRIGASATQALIAGEEGRFMRALKSLLGTPLLREERRLNGERINFIEIIARFLREIKTRAEAATYQEFTHALSGRPVRFHSRDDTRNAQAETDLRDCYLAAGFQDVRFMYEPEAAARATVPDKGLGLIVDIGGGTSDFSLFRQQDSGETEILASYGLRIGGTDFDRRLSIDHVMPLLGRGSAIRNAFGLGTLPAPARIFNDLATWQMIPFLYAADSRHKAQDLASNATEPTKLARLVTVLEDELGHDIAFAVERGKIQSNQPDHPAPRIDLKDLERGLMVPLTEAMVQNALATQVDEIAAGAAETLALAGVRADQVDRVVLVGGSSLMTVIEHRMSQLCPEARIHRENAMTAVADGLALSAATAFD
ncbi:Hsp70 family protein [Parasedimentitalea psychrophila]|uniref:Hsp70 family protein n=1 Tax=Parasedimentitalea psychrophila TaxID=2997337 RepID=A0A9Y2KW46_9RHOB|nr:Hsp70 family protein [Parasedimentitalea psychrophila]WIY23619.1 Hsp70 family protein [Parasedimentitalea psychrophila]